MRNLLLLLLPFVLFFAACQKETSFEAPSTTATGTTAIGTATGTATYTLSGAGSTCTGAIVSGIYQAGTALVASDTVQLQINVAIIGTYAVSTNTSNGIVFVGSGSFTATGIQTITLLGSGTPLVAGNFIFSPPVGLGCSFVVPSTTATIATTSAYTLTGAPNACTGASVSGAYTAGTALTNADTVVVSVNVITIGTFSLITNKVNGISFAVSGTFNTLGVQNVTLKGIGTPTTATTNTFTPQIGTSACNFTITFVAPAPATFTLAGAPSTCTGATVTGTYMVSKPLITTNTITISVNVATIGSYVLSTNTVNGMSFSASGTFTATGIQNVILVGTGMPTTAGNNTLTPQFGTSGCTVVVAVAAAPVPAVYTMAGAPTTCTGATVNGTYAASTALTSTNTVIVSVNVTTIGTYALTTNTVNGIKFNSTGTFTSTGIQNVTLIGAGTPTAAQTSTLIPQIGTSGCTFDVLVGAAPTVAPGIYNCKIDGVYNSFSDRGAVATVIDPFGATELGIDGYAAVDPNQTYTPHFQIFINHLNNSPITTGSYNVDGYLSTNGYRLEIDYNATNPDGSVTIWNTSSTLFTPNPPFTVIVTSATATRFKGTFSGKITNLLMGSTIQKTITEGVFDVPVK